MPSYWAIEAVDVSANGSFGGDAGFEGGSPDQFRLQRLEHGFHHGIVVAVSLSAHGYDETVGGQELLVVVRAILAAAIRMVNDALRRPADSDGALEGV